MRNTRAIHIILALVIVLSLCASVLMLAPAHAQTWPSDPSWIQVDSDPNESGTSNDYRDVRRAYYSYNATHLFLRLETYDTPDFPNKGARFKWLIDVGIGSNLYWSGSNILGSDYILMVEDSDNDGGRDVYLLEANCPPCTTPYDRYGYYEPGVYEATPGPIVDPTIAGYRTTGNFVDLYIKFTEMGISGPSNLSLIWATDQENPNLEQGPTLDSMDQSDTPFHVDANVRVTKDVDNHTPLEWDNIIYTVTVTNTGPADATNIEVTDLLPGDVTYVSDSPSQGTYDDGTGNWSVGNLAFLASATLTITANVSKGTAGWEIKNTANITAVDQPDSYLDDNLDFTNIYPEEVAAPELADLVVIKMCCTCRAQEGDIITYTVTVINTGPDDANSIVITDHLPSCVTYQSDSASQGTYDDGTGNWSVGNLVDGASATLDIIVTVNSGTCGSTVFNTANVTAVLETDPHSQDNYGICEFVSQSPSASAAGHAVPAFPTLYVGIAAALGAGVLAYLLRRRSIGQRTEGI